jgi:hypothetical protein
MVNLVSPEYNFEAFCQRMIGRNPMEVLDAASAEITYARGNCDGPSKRRIYCENLQRLIPLSHGNAST